MNRLSTAHRKQMKSTNMPERLNVREASCRYTLRDCLMYALAMFKLKWPSLLRFERESNTNHEPASAFYMLWEKVRGLLDHVEIEHWFTAI